MAATIQPTNFLSDLDIAAISDPRLRAMPRLITEHNARLREQSGSRWAVTLITPGRGSSGTYSEEVLARDAATAFPAGTKMWFGHPKEGEHAGDRDPRDQWGFLAADARWSQEAEGVVGEVQVLPHWADVVNSLGTQADLSIYAFAEFDDEDNVTALLGNRTNSVDIVSYPGRPGSGLDRKIEAAREAADQTSVDASADVQEGEHMELVLEALEKLTASLAPVIAFVNESKDAKSAEAQAEVDAEAIADAVGEALSAYQEQVAAIDAAELLEPVAEGLRARALAGENITAAIESAKADNEKILEAAKARLEESADDSFAGRVRDGAATEAASSVVPKGW